MIKTILLATATLIVATAAQAGITNAAPANLYPGR